MDGFIEIIRDMLLSELFNSDLSNLQESRGKLCGLDYEITASHATV